MKVNYIPSHFFYVSHMTEGEIKLTVYEQSNSEKVIFWESNVMFYLFIIFLSFLLFCWKHFCCADA